MNRQIIHGDCVEAMAKMLENSVDAIVTDPPYGISFMGKKWDYNVPKVEVWQEALRVLKPGGHALIACGTRTQHRMAVNIEDAGFEIRDIVGWIYGSGFPKSLDVSKAIDKAAGVERMQVGEKKRGGGPTGFTSEKGWNPSAMGNEPKMTPVFAPATDSAKQWSGYGTALKPAMELWTLARKPLSEPTVAANVLKWGTGGINVDGCRVEGKPRLTGTRGDGEEIKAMPTSFKGSGTRDLQTGYDERMANNNLGRFPANFIHDGSQMVLGLFPNTGKGNNSKPYNYAGKEYDNKDTSMFNGDKPQAPSNFNDSGSAARYFYCAKASKAERNKGCEGMDEKQQDESRKPGNPGGDNPRNRGVHTRANNHPTVKPIALMRYLCRLITPPSGVVLDPFMGSGSTGIACVREGFGFIGIEREEEYCEIANRRIKEKHDSEN